MMPRQTLHQLVDDLPDSDLPTITRVLEAMRATAVDPLVNALDRAPLDDEPDDDDVDGALSQARRDAEAGRGITTAKLRRELGLS